jgi:hypothetical protein
MKLVASRLDVDKRFLYKHFPPLCRAVSARHSKHQKACYEQLRKRREKDTEQVANKLQASGIYPSRRRVALLAKSMELRKERDAKRPQSIAC